MTVMSFYEMIARRGMMDETDGVAEVRAADPFKLLIDEDARKAVVERAMGHEPTRGHRNLIKAVPAELDA
jgi:hypothetical protein